MRKITFKNITLQSAGHPIIIDQFYGNVALDEVVQPKKLRPLSCLRFLNLSTTYEQFSLVQQGGVQVSQVSYIGIQGTSSGPEAITFNCSSVGCRGITLENINIKSSNGGQTYVSCANAHGTYRNSNPRVDCLLHH